MLDETAIRRLARELVADPPSIETVRERLDAYLVETLSPRVEGKS